ncbi:MAG: EAL domain-containing protein [Pseudomonadota bacterium]|nr:EAL domain-containing protein [Pseudomonadota bacterium]
MTGMPSSSAWEHWSAAWKERVCGEPLSVADMLPARHSGSGQLLEQLLLGFMQTTRQTLEQDLQAALQCLAARTGSSCMMLFLCPQDEHSSSHCIISQQGSSQDGAGSMLTLFETRHLWCSLVHNDILLLDPTDEREASCHIRARMDADYVLLVPVSAHVSGSGCLLMALDDNTRQPDADERSLLSNVVQLCYLVADRVATTASLQEREQRLQRTEQLVGLGSWYDDIASGRMTFSRQAGQLFDLEPQQTEASLEEFYRHIHPDDLGRLQTIYDELRSSAEATDVVFRILASDGSSKVIHSVVEAVFSDDGQVIGRAGSVQDITEKYQQEQRLKQAARVFDSTMEGVVITNARGLIEQVNPAFTTITGYREEEVRGRLISLLNSRRHDPSFFRTLLKDCAEKGYWHGEIWNRRKNGEVFPQSVTVTTIRDDDDEIIQYVAVFADITRIKRSEEQVDYLAHHDPLTGLPNRHSLLGRLDEILRRAAVQDSSVAIISIDLDHFKHINDSLGHPAGDRLLQSCARRLRQRLRDTDIVARPGGDEFFVVLENVSDQDQVVQMTEVLQGLFSRAFDVGVGHEIFIGASFGITLYPDHGRNVTQLISNADVAMYCAKQQGRNHYQFYTNEMTQAANDRLELGSQLRHALQEEHELVLRYQPQVSADNGAMVGAEALLRWQHPQQGLMQPGRFLPVAEDNGLMPELDNWVLSHACQQLAQWQQAGCAPFVLAVNISQPTFVAGSLAGRVEELLTLHRLDPSWLELEITEGALLEPTPQILATIARLKELGVSLSVDDFGTGYSSLAYLHRYRVDKIKIDRSFVNSVEEEEEGRVITRTIMTMAEGLGLKILAEGVETAGQLAFMRDNGCDICQGFYFSRPLPLAEFHGWLEH